MLARGWVEQTYFHLLEQLSAQFINNNTEVERQWQKADNRRQGMIGVFVTLHALSKPRRMNSTMYLQSQPYRKGKSACGRWTQEDPSLLIDSTAGKVK
jgi:hypothetical protein